MTLVNDGFAISAVVIWRASAVPWVWAKSCPSLNSHNISISSSSSQRDCLRLRGLCRWETNSVEAAESGSCWASEDVLCGSGCSRCPVENDFCGWKEPRFQGSLEA